MSGRPGSVWEPGLEHRVVRVLLAMLERRPAMASLVHSLLELAQETSAVSRLYACGGQVRDLVLAEIRGQPSVLNDFDLVIEGISDAGLDLLMAGLATRCRAVRWTDRVGESFSVWKVKLHGPAEAVDVARTRGPGIESVAHPARADGSGVSLAEDSQRRDFTMNALYVQLEPGPGDGLHGRLVDFHGGVADIAAGRVRCVGDPAARLTEDPLRILRAIRFAATLGGFTFAAETAAAMGELAPRLLPSVARDRVPGELYRALVADPQLSIAELERFAVLETLAPPLAALGQDGLKRAAATVRGVLDLVERPAAPPVAFAALLYQVAAVEVAGREAFRSLAAPLRPEQLRSEVVPGLARDLRLPDLRRISRLVHGAVVLAWQESLHSAGAVVEEVLAFEPDRAHILALHQAAAAAAGVKAPNLRAWIAGFPATRLDVGKLFAEGLVAPGPHLVRLKRALRQAEIDGVVGTEDEARALLDTLVDDTIEASMGECREEP